MLYGTALKCEKAYKKGLGSIQVRTESDRLVNSGYNIEAVELNITRSNCRRYVWRRYYDFGTVRWISRLYTKV